MKLYAGRPQDIQDIYAQIASLTSDDLAFMEAYLDSLKQPWRKHIKPDQLERGVRGAGRAEEGGPAMTPLRPNRR